MEEKRRTRLYYYKEIAKKKGFRQETIEMGCMLACTVEMTEKFGSIDNALEEVIKLCEKHDNPQEFIGEIGALIGID